MSRRPLDFYQSGDYQVRALLAHQQISGTVLECCVGDGCIARLIQPYCDQLTTNDIDTERAADAHLDAASPTFCEDIARYGDCGGRFDWVCSNPPYAMPTCLQIVQNAWTLARVGVIMQLRITFKEPTKGTKKTLGRGHWLRDHPISRELTLPRHSFTGDGKSDNTTTSWFIWLKNQRSADDIPFDALFDQSHVSLFDAERIFASVPKDTEHSAASVYHQ